MKLIQSKGKNLDNEKKWVEVHFTENTFGRIGQKNFMASPSLPP
jgi:hypothetical protein